MVALVKSNEIIKVTSEEHELLYRYPSKCRKYLLRTTAASRLTCFRSDTINDPSVRLKSICSFKPIDNNSPQACNTTCPQQLIKIRLEV